MKLGKCLPAKMLQPTTTLQTLIIYLHILKGVRTCLAYNEGPKRRCFCFWREIQVFVVISCKHVTPICQTLITYFHDYFHILKGVRSGLAYHEGPDLTPAGQRGDAFVSGGKFIFRFRLPIFWPVRIR